MRRSRKSPSARLWEAVAKGSWIQARLDPEAAHGLLLWLLRHDPLPSAPVQDDPILASCLWGRMFPNPLGLAAGFDKNAEVMAAMLGLGLGFVEVGSITPRPQPGNPRPRLFRLPEEQAVINRMGFNNQGAEATAGRLATWRASGSRGILGVNLGKNKDSAAAASDYAAGAGRLGPLADYLVVNVSSPNTPGLRALQGAEELAAIVTATRTALDEVSANPPLLVKIAPDLDAAGLEAVTRAAVTLRVDGLIVSNTTTSRPAGLTGRARGEAGGLSGRPLFEPATRCLADCYRLTEGRLPLIGVGGVAGPAEAYAKIRAGACLVQLYTGLAYEGPGLVERIKRGLAALLRGDGFVTLGEAVGAEHRL